MPRTPEQYVDIRSKKKKVILDAALGLFADKGYASASISCIAEKYPDELMLQYRDYLKSLFINNLEHNLNNS